jgi:hypothetical protein
MIRRLALFGSWAVVGMALTYASLYVFTPYGLALIVMVAIAAMLLVLIWDSGWPDSIGLAAGPGGFCLLLAANSDVNAAVFATLGVSIISTVAATYVLLMRARCARGRIS